MKLSDFPKHIQPEIKRKIAFSDRPAVQTADVEQDANREIVEPNSDKETDKRVSVHIHSKRKRLTDPDGVCHKYVIDALVDCGLLPDDSHEYIKQVSFSQEKAETDETIIEIWG